MIGVVAVGVSSALDSVVVAAFANAYPASQNARPTHKNLQQSSQFVVVAADQYVPVDATLSVGVDLAAAPISAAAAVAVVTVFFVDYAQLAMLAVLAEQVVHWL